MREEKLNIPRKSWPWKNVVLVAIAPSVLTTFLMRAFGDSGIKLEYLFLIINAICSSIAGIGSVKGRMTVVGGSIPVAILLGLVFFAANFLIIAVIGFAFFFQIRGC